MAPPWQWKRAGTDRQVLDKVTIEPASRTPKPNKWLNSRPTPFMVHWNLRLASNSELRFEVNTVKCWMSLQVNNGLLRKPKLKPRKAISFSQYIYSKQSSLLGFQSKREDASSFGSSCRCSRVCFSALSVQISCSLCEAKSVL